MFKTISTVALIGAAQAIKLTDTTAVPATAADIEDILAKAQSGDYTTEDVENIMEKIDHHMKGKDVTDAIDWAAEQGVGFEEIKAMIEGVEVSQAFDKHDIYNFAMDACCHFEVDQAGLDEMLHYAGKKLGITAEQGEELLETAGDVFDISQEEFDQALQDCFDIGAKCAAKKAGEGKPQKLAEESVSLDELKEFVENVDWENLTPEEAANFLKENEGKIMKALKDHQVPIVSFLAEHEDEIKAFVAEHEDKLKDFAAGLEEHLGDIDWDQVKADVEEYVEGGLAKIEEKKRKAKAKKQSLAQQSLDEVKEFVENVDWENLTPEEAAKFLKENQGKIMKALKKHQGPIAKFLAAHEDEIKQFAAENEEELKAFAAGLEENLGDIDWEQVHEDVVNYVEEGVAK